MKNFRFLLLVGFLYLCCFTVHAQSIFPSIDGALGEQTISASANAGTSLSSPAYSDTSLKKNDSSEKVALTAKKKGSMISLEWRNEPGVVNSLFEIERSNDGKMFRKIGESAFKNENVSSPYIFLDQNPLPVNYYRLKMINEEGGFTYSKEVVISQAGTLHTAVQPNPFIRSFNVDVYLSDDQPIKIQLLDMNGRLLRYKSVTGRSGSNQIEFDDVGSLQPGIYMVRIVRGYSVVEKKIVKSN